MNNHKDEDLVVDGLCVRVFGMYTVYGCCGGAVEHFFSAGT